MSIDENTAENGPAVDACAEKPGTCSLSEQESACTGESTAALQTVEEPTCTVPADDAPRGLITVAGVVVEEEGSIDPLRLARVTEGRTQVSLKVLLRGNRVFQGDTYVACVCYGVCGASGIKVSDLVFSGTSEAVMYLDEADESSCEKLVGATLLILNPALVRGNICRAASLKSCLKLGTVSDISACVADGCEKPLITHRDGTLCCLHAAEKCSIRKSIGGTMLKIEEPVRKTKSDIKRKTPTTTETNEKKRQSLLAKKRAVTMLYNRRNSLLSGGDVKLDFNDGALIEMSDNESCIDENLVEKLASFKRKRDTL